MATNTLFYKQRLASWNKNFKTNSNFIPFEQDSAQGDKIKFSDVVSNMIV